MRGESHQQVAVEPAHPAPIPIQRERKHQIRSQHSLRHEAGGFPAVEGPHAGSEDSNGAAELRESVIGFYLVEAADEAAAHSIARECPVVLIGGSVEVRETEFFPGQ